MPSKISAFAPLAIGILLPRWGGAQARQDTIPFVGCPADGQAGPIEAPKGPPKVVAGTEVPASRLAYYKGEEAPGLFGPRGWHCRVWYGSSGSTLIITPTVIDSTLGLPRKLQGEALELSVSSGGTSGRFVVAHYAARLFPRVAAKFIARVQNEGLAPASEFQSGPYPHDSVKYLGTLVAEFTTPAGVKGLGTGGSLSQSPDPIRGVAVLDQSDADEPDLLIMRERLGSDLRDVAGAIFKLNRACMQRTQYC